MSHTIHQTLNRGPIDNTGADSGSFGVNPTAGRSVVGVVWGWNAGNFSIASGVTDNQGNTYSTSQSTLQNGMRVAFFWCHNIAASGTFTITITPASGSANYYTWSALEVSNLRNQAPFTASNNGTASTTPSSGNTATTGTDGLNLAALVVATSQSSITVGGSYTQIQEQLDSIAHQGGESDRIDYSSAAAQSASWTLSTSSNFSAGIAAFDDAPVNFNAQGTSTFTVVGGAQNYGRFSGDGTSTFAVAYSYVPPVGFSAQGTAAFSVSGVISVSTRWSARGEAQFVVVPNTLGGHGAFRARGDSTFFVVAQPQTAPGSLPQAPPAALAPYGNLKDVSAIIHGFGGQYVFDQYGTASPSGGEHYPLENLTFETRIPGGDMSATITTRLNGTTIHLPSPGSLAVISDLAGPFWLGIFDAPEIEYWTDGAIVSLHCLGVAAWADDEVFLERTVFEDSDTAGDIIRRARDRLLHGINYTDDFLAASIETPIGERTQSYRGHTAQMALNDACAMGSTYLDADQLIWELRLPLAAGYPASVPILAAYSTIDAPSYTLDVTDGYVIRQQGPSRSRVRNQIFVNYGTGTGDPLHETNDENRVINAFDPDGWADIDYRPRMMWLDAPGEKLYWGAMFAAGRIANANLAKYGRLRTAGETLTIPHDGQGGHRPVVDPGPNTVPIWRIRAGYRLNLDNRPTFTGIGSLRSDLITSTRFSLKDAKTEISTGVMNDSRQARRMTGLATLRQLMDVPPLAHPNPTPEWQRVNIELGPWDPHDDPGKVMVEFPHLLRTVNVLVWRLLSETADLESVDFLVGVGSRDTPGSYDVIAETTVSLSGDSTSVQVMNGLSRRAEPGEMYTFFFRNPVPSGMRCLGVLGVDRMKQIG